MVLRNYLNIRHQNKNREIKVTVILGQAIFITILEKNYAPLHNVLEETLHNRLTEY